MLFDFNALVCEYYVHSDCQDFVVSDCQESATFSATHKKVQFSSISYLENCSKTCFAAISGQYSSPVSRVA